MNLGKGVLYMVPVPIGEVDPQWALPPATLKVLQQLTVIISENAKTTRALLKQIQTAVPLQQIEVIQMEKHGQKVDFDLYFDKLRKGIDTGVMSESGMPGIADPGSAFALQAHRENIRVVPLTGPSSIFLALSASGLNGQHFSFHGYLPKDNDERARKIALLEKNSSRFSETQLFIETPYRNQLLFNELLRNCNGNTLVCIASDITGPNEFIKTLPVAEWKRNVPELPKLPTLFLLG